MHRVAILVLGLCALGVIAFPTNDQAREAEVIKITDADAPIVLPPSDDAENVILRDTANATAAAAESQPATEGSSGPAPPLPPAASPSPLPDNVAVTTEKFVQSTPNLVPTVVDISTPGPNSTPAPANATTTPTPEDEDDESDEEDSEEEAEADADEEEDDDEEEDEEEDDDEEEEDDEDKEEEEDEEEKKRDAGKKKKSGDKKKRVTRAVGDDEIGGSVKIPARKEKPASVVFGIDGEDDKSDEEEAVAPVGVKKNAAGVANKAVVESGSKLQGIPARTPTNEDDEADSGSP